MKTRAYIDTNVFIYAFDHHPTYDEDCVKVLGDVMSGKLLNSTNTVVMFDVDDGTKVARSFDDIKGRMCEEAVKVPFRKIHVVALSEYASLHGSACEEDGRTWR